MSEQEEMDFKVLQEAYAQQKKRADKLEALYLKECQYSKNLVAEIKLLEASNVAQKARA